MHIFKSRNVYVLNDMNIFIVDDSEILETIIAETAVKKYIQFFLCKYI